MQYFILLRVGGNQQKKEEKNCLANNIVLGKEEIVQQPAIYLDDKKRDMQSRACLAEHQWQLHNIFMH